MNKVLSCAGLDFKLVKPYTKSVLFLLALGIFMGFMFKSSETLSSYIMVMIMLVMSYPFAVIDKNRLDILYGTLSISRKAIVIGRYVFVLIFIAACTLLSFGCSVILSAIVKEEIVLSQLLLLTCVLFAAVSLVVALQYPIYFKLGYAKAKIVAMIPLFIIFSLIILIPTIAKLANLNFFLTGMFESLAQHAVILSISALLVGLIFLGISCYVSYKLYEKKDM